MSHRAKEAAAQPAQEAGTVGGLRRDPRQEPRQTAVMSSVQWVCIDSGGGTPAKIDSFKSPTASVAESDENVCYLPSALMQKIAQLCLSQGDLALVCLSRSPDLRASSFVLLDRACLKSTTEKRLQPGAACAAPRPSHYAALSSNLLDRLHCDRRQLHTVRGGVPAFRTIYQPIYIGVWNLGVVSVPRGVPLKVSWRLQNVECFGAPPSATTKGKEECLVGVSSAIVQTLEDQAQDVLLLSVTPNSASASTNGTVVSVLTANAIRPTDQRLLKNSCAASEPERHVWLSAALRQAMRLEKKEERKHVAVFKSLYQPVSLGFLSTTSPSVSDGAGSGKSKSSGFKSSALGQAVCTAAREVLTKLAAAPRRSAITRYMTRGEEGGEGEILEIGESRFIEPYQSYNAGEALEALSIAPPFEPPSTDSATPSTVPPQSPFSIAHSAFSPASTARSSLEAQRLSNNFIFHGCVFGTVAPHAPVADGPVWSSLLTPLKANSKSEGSGESAKSTPASGARSTSTPGSSSRRPGSRSGTPAANDTPVTHRLLPEPLDRFTATQIPRAEHALPRYYIDNAGLVRELLAIAIRRAKKEGKKKRSSGKEENSMETSILSEDAPPSPDSPDKPKALHASLLALHDPPSQDSPLTYPLRFTSADHFYSFFLSLPSVQEALAQADSGGKSVEELNPGSAPSSPSSPVTSSSARPAWARVLDPRDLRPGDVVVVRTPASSVASPSSPALGALAALDDSGDGDAEIDASADTCDGNGNGDGSGDAGGEGATDNADADGGGESANAAHVWVVLDIHLNTRTQRVTACTIVESCPSSRRAVTASDLGESRNRGGVRTRLLPNAKWARSGGQGGEGEKWVIGRILL